MYIISLALYLLRNRINRNEIKKLLWLFIYFINGYLSRNFLLNFSSLRLRMQREKNVTWKQYYTQYYGILALQLRGEIARWSFFVTCFSLQRRRQTVWSFMQPPTAPTVTFVPVFPSQETPAIRLRFLSRCFSPRRAPSAAKLFNIAVRGNCEFFPALPMPVAFLKRAIAIATRSKEGRGEGELSFSWFIILQLEFFFYNRNIYLTSEVGKGVIESVVDDTRGSVVDPRVGFSVWRNYSSTDPRSERLKRIKMRTTLSRLVRFGLHIYGIWPYAPSTVLFRLYWIMMLSMAQVFQYRYVIVNIHMDDFSQFMDGVSSAMASSLLYIKLVLLWTNQRYDVHLQNITNLVFYRIHYTNLLTFLVVT